MRISNRNTVIALLLLLLFGPAVSAQSLTATITGRAADASGGLLPGAAVTITSPAMIGGERTTVTDGEGVYRLTLLPPGEYRVVEWWTCGRCRGRIRTSGA